MLSDAFREQPYTHSLHGMNLPSLSITLLISLASAFLAIVPASVALAEFDVEPAAQIATQAVTKTAKRATDPATSSGMIRTAAKAVSTDKAASESGRSAIALPPLGNTAESDRPLLREIGDQHIYDPARGKTGLAGHATLSDNNNASTGQNETRTPEPAPAQTVWQFVQQSRRLDIPDNERVASYREQYREEALWISKILHRATPFAGHIVEALDQRFLPVELALLPAIESGYQPDVHSAEYAAGIWQIVPATAADIGIERTAWFDGRADIVESTVAAIDYLSYLNAEFHGDWLLTLAAYNAGPGRVRSAVKRNEKQGLPVDFWSLKLPTETQNYVPKFLALVDMLRHENAPAFDIPTVPRGDGFEVVELQRRVSVDKLATYTGLSERALRRLNAALVHGVTPPGGPHRIYLQKGQAQQLRNSLAKSQTETLYTLPATHTVVAGDNLSTLALRYGLTERQLRNMNALDNSTIVIGQELAIRQDAEGSNIEYVVTIGDTLSEIARRFSVQVDNIRDVEGELLTSDLIHPGVRLSIVIDSEPAG